MNRNNLKQNQYTVSLMIEGLRTGLLSDQEIYDIQSRLMLLLQNLIKRYTQGESSSVTVETAESIFTSMLYAVDAYFHSLESPEEAMTYLKMAEITSLYEQGVETVSRCFEETKRLYGIIRKNKLDVSVDAYNMTIDESVPVFMKKYEILFEAHNTMASIDYPLAIDDMRLQGVFYMKQYLERLHIETEFIQLFEHKDLLDTLVNFGRVCRFDYRIELFNMYELMLNNAVFSIVSGMEEGQVRISAYQLEQLERVLTQAPPEQIQFIIQEAVHRLQRELQIGSRNLREYMNQCIAGLVQRVVHAANSRSLQAVIITRQEERIKPVEFSLNPEDRMTDVELRKLLDEVMECGQKEDKARLIKSRLYSLHDYLDVLESDILYGDEYEALFGLFGDMELAILAKIVLYEELRNDSLDFQAIVSVHEGSDEEWKTCYIAFMQGLSLERLRVIGQLIEIIDYEAIKFY